MRIVFFLLIYFLSNAVLAQEKYWVYLADKDGVVFDPENYFDQKAIKRRNKLNIPLDHYTDKPIRADYREQITSIADSVCGHTRWFNALSCVLSPSQLTEIQSLPFVQKVVPMTTQMVLAGSYRYGDLHNGEKALLKGQIEWMRGNEFTKKGFTGKGIRICIIDAGFPNVNTSNVYKHIRDQNHILKTWDFKKNKPDVYKFNSHGATVLSCIAGKIDDVNIGLAVDAEFLLARTERIMYEGIAEEEDWLMAIEWADKNGADIINSSLGYTTASHFKEHMDGETCIITRAGNLAARKGILVVNAAGNDGDGNWKYIGAPADADSVLSIGGINPWTGLHTSFSSYGPTADHRMKPNVAAFGHVMGYGASVGVHETQGTSFASPLVAGFAACAWQSDTSLSNMDLFLKIEKSANLFPYFDYAHGYGMPQATYFTDSIQLPKEATFQINEDDNYVHLVINDTSFTVEDQVLQNYYPSFGQLQNIPWIHIPDNYSSSDSNLKQGELGYFYYHIENKTGYLDKYFVLSVYKKNILSLSKNQYLGKTFRFHYKGFTQSITIK